MAGRAFSVKALATAVVDGRDGAMTIRDVRSEPPYTLRHSGGRLLLVGSSAAPVGGDELRLQLVVEPMSVARVGTAAATIVWPGPHGERSSTRHEFDVGADAHLDWEPCPTVSVAGSDHRSHTLIRLAPGATCRIVEELALGREREPSGMLEASVRIERDGQPIVHHRERFGPEVAGWGSTAAVGQARFVHQEFIVGLDAGGPRCVVDQTRSAAWLPMAPDVVAVLAVGIDRPSVRAALVELGAVGSSVSA
jgi:urease accessory protein